MGLQGVDNVKREGELVITSPFTALLKYPCCLRFLPLCHRTSYPRVTRLALPQSHGNR